MHFRHQVAPCIHLMLCYLPQVRVQHWFQQTQPVMGKVSWASSEQHKTMAFNSQTTLSTFNASVIAIWVPLKQDLQQSTDNLTSRLWGRASLLTILTSGINPAAKYFPCLPKSLFSNGNKNWHGIGNFKDLLETHGINCGSKWSSDL